MLDPEASELVQFTYTVDDDATAEQIAEQMARINQAAWLAIAKNNGRKLQRSKLVRDERRAGIIAAKAAGQKVSERPLQQEEAEINTAIVKLEADIAATAKMLNGDAAPEA